MSVFFHLGLFFSVIGRMRGWPYVSSGSRVPRPPFVFRSDVKEAEKSGSAEPAGQLKWSETGGF